MRSSAAVRRACPDAWPTVVSARWADAACVNRNGLRPASSRRNGPTRCHAVPPAPSPLEGEGAHAHVVVEIQGRAPSAAEQQQKGQQKGAPWQLMGRMVPEGKMPGLLGRQQLTQREEEEEGATWQQQQQQQLPAGLMGRQQQEDAAFMRQIARRMLRWGQRGLERPCTPRSPPLPACVGQGCSAAQSLIYPHTP